MIAAAAFAVITGKKVAGMHDHASGIDRRIAAECRGRQVQGFDGDRSARFGGTLPEIFDSGDEAFVSLEIDGMKASGYDRGSSSAYTAEVSADRVQLYDHGEAVWFVFDIQLVE